MRELGRDIFDAINTEADIQSLISGQVENLYVDFKIKRDLTSHLVDDDLQKVLSKAISGFANSDGGVLFLGVDAPQGAVPSIRSIAPFQLFEQEVNSYISRATQFVVQGILIKSIPTPSFNGGVVSVYIPKSDLGPHCSMKDKKYYQRIGDSFSPMEHYQIADSFGRRHFPHIIPMGLLSGDINTKGKIEVLFGLKNEGRAIGKFLYLKVVKQAGFTFNRFGVSGNGHFGLPPFPNPTNFSEYRGGADDVLHPGLELPVTRMDQSFSVNPQGIPVHPFTDLVVEGVIAADGFSAKNWTLTIDAQSIQAVILNPRGQRINIVGQLL